jgi:hypothetical protein
MEANRKKVRGLPIEFLAHHKAVETLGASALPDGP